MATTATDPELLRLETQLMRQADGVDLEGEEGDYENEDDSEEAQQRRKLEEEAASRDASEKKERLVEHYAEQVMDLTLGRFQAVHHDTRNVQDFLRLCSMDVKDTLREAMSAATKAASNLSEDEAQSRLAQQRLEQLQVQLEASKSTELFLRSLSSEVIKDATLKTTQVQSLTGVIQRRDQLLNEQRKAYYRELTHLREMIRQQRKGNLTLSDASFYNWNQDDLAEQIAKEREEQEQRAREEERAKFDKELEAVEERYQKKCDDLRRTISMLETQILQFTVPVHRIDEETQIELEFDEKEVQTEDVRVSSIDDDSADGGALTARSNASSSASLGRNAVPSLIDQSELIGKQPDGDDDPLSPARSLKGSSRPGSGKGPRKGSKRSSDSGGGGDSRPSSASGLGSPKRPPSTQFPVNRSDSIAAIAKDLEATLGNDLVMLRLELAKAKDTLTGAQQQLTAKEAEVAKLSKKRMDEEQKNRRTEQQLSKRFTDELRAKEKILDQKTRELDQLQDETQRWFAQYRQSQPPDQTPVNFAVLRKLHTAVSEAEKAEERYRTTSWELLVSNLRRRTVLEGLHVDCQEAQAAQDIPQLRELQHQYDVVHHHLWQKNTRLKQERQRLRDTANQAWDVVLYYARSTMHPGDPVGPPPRYYNVDDLHTAQLNTEAAKEASNAKQLQRAVHEHQRDVQRKNGLPGSNTVAIHGFTASHSTKRPSSAPSIRQANALIKDAETNALSPFAVKLRKQIMAAPDAMLEVRPPHQQQQHQNSQLADSRGAGRGNRPQSAVVANRSGGSGGGAFNPSMLRDKKPSEQRELLRSLMRHDRQSLVDEKQRHIETIHRDRQSRSQSVMSQNQKLRASMGSSGSSPAGPYHQCKLYGRCESVPGERVPEVGVSSSSPQKGLN